MPEHVNRRFVRKKHSQSVCQPFGMPSVPETSLSLLKKTLSTEILVEQEEEEQKVQKKKLKELKNSFSSAYRVYSFDLNKSIKKGMKRIKH